LHFESTRSPRRFPAAKSQLLRAAAAAFGFTCMASAALNPANALASVSLTGMCATTDGGALMRVNSPSADTTASLQIYGDPSSKVSAFAKAGTNTYVFVPKANIEGGQKTITMSTSPDVGSSVKVSNKSLCSQTLTVTSSLTNRRGARVLSKFIESLFGIRGGA